MIFQDEIFKGTALHQNYLYLDICFTEDQMVCPDSLLKVRKVDNPLRLHTNAGASQTDWNGYLGGTPFWLDERGTTNVIFLHTLEHKLRIRSDSAQYLRSFISDTHWEDWFCALLQGLCILTWIVRKQRPL